MIIKVYNRNYYLALNILNQELRNNFIPNEWRFLKRRAPKKPFQVAKWAIYRKLKARKVGKS